MAEDEREVAAVSDETRARLAAIGERPAGMFLTNPSPICFLDEVDAPLDDANVERFCELLRTMAGETETRFVVITHNPITMARMDRLFGVTMAERGLSTIVSVDLEAAERLREAG